MDYLVAYFTSLIAGSAMIGTGYFVVYVWRDDMPNVLMKVLISAFCFGLIGLLFIANVMLWKGIGG